MKHRFVLLVVLAAVVVASCAPRAENELVGIVVEVDGDLTETRSFTVVDADGTRWVLVPVDGLLFEDGAPLSHLTEHVRTGQSVRVRYETDEAGQIRAVIIDDVR